VEESDWGSVVAMSLADSGQERVTKERVATAMIATLLLLLNLFLSDGDSTPVVHANGLQT
jgi:hypothetical protein